MNNEFIDWENLHKSTFSFPGNYRAIVEDTEDPLGAGRVRVRVIGLHSPDPDVTPVDHLIWAEPALSLYYAGGQMTNTNLNDEIRNKSSDRYYPTKDVESSKNDIPDQDVRELTPTDGIWKDEITEKCGASAIYTVPRKGSVVWVFFENDFHGRCHYWAAATRAIDWTVQREKIDEVINGKRNEVQQLRDSITIDAGERQIDKDDHTDTVEPVQRLKVFTKIPDPKLFIHRLDNIRNDEITSFTSAFGTTYIVVNKNGQERTYVFHKGSAEYVDGNGQVKKLVGLSENDIDQSQQANDYQMMVGNNYDLHVIGDFNIYAKNNVHIDAEQDLYAVVRRNAGIVVKSGDLDLLCENGHANLSCPKGNVNIRCQEAQAKVENNLVAEIGENADLKIIGDAIINVDGEINAHSIGDINLSSDSNINMESSGDINLTATNINGVGNQSLNLLGNESLSLVSTGKIDALGGDASLRLSPGIAQMGGVSTDIAGNVRIGGNITMGASSGPPGGGESASTEPVEIPPWGSWKESTERINKEFSPNEQMVDDSDDAS